MNTPLYGLLNSRDRDVLTNAADAITLLHLDGAADLAQKLRCVAQTQRPSRDLLVTTAALGTHVRINLLAQASPDQWLSSLGHDVTNADMNLLGGLVAERQNQAQQVAAAIAICEKVMDRAPVGV